MIRSIPFQAPWRAAEAIRELLRSDAADTVVDVMLIALGAVGAVALCRSFLQWRDWELDWATVVALGFMIAFVASMCWWLKLVLRWILHGPAIRQRVGRHSVLTPSVLAL